MKAADIEPKFTVSLARLRWPHSYARSSDLLGRITMCAFAIGFTRIARG